MKRKFGSNGPTPIAVPTEEVERRCVSGRLPTLTGQQQMPRLAKQRIDYMIYTMKSYLAGTRSGADTLMTAAIMGLSDADLAALAHYAASR